MIKRANLGSTGIEVSSIGLGTVKWGRNQAVKYPKTFSLPSDHEIVELLECAQEVGINLLDTAPAYGVSEERLGQILKGKRNDWVICTKVGEEFINGKSYFDFSSSAIKGSIERSLQRLQTDVLDIVLVHSDGSDEELIKGKKVFETLSEIKQSGKIRAFGMSTKTLAGGLLAVENADVVMVTYNPIYVDEQPVIAEAYRRQKGILVKKALASGHLEKISKENPVEMSMQFIFKQPGVSSVVIGTLNSRHLLQVSQCI